MAAVEDFLSTKRAQAALAARMRRTQVKMDAEAGDAAALAKRAKELDHIAKRFPHGFPKGKVRVRSREQERLKKQRQRARQAERRHM